MKYNIFNKISGIRAEIGLMILIGVAASVAFFVISNLVIDVKTKEFQNTRKERTKEVIEANFDALKGSYSEVTALIQELSRESIASNNKYKGFDTQISSLFWIDAKELSLSSNVKARPIRGHYSINDMKYYLTQENIGKIKEVYKIFSKKDLGLIKNIPAKIHSTKDITEKWNQNSGKVLLTTLIRTKDKTLGVVVAVVDFKNVFWDLTRYEDLGVTNISVLSNQMSSGLFEISRENSGSWFEKVFGDQKISYAFPRADFQSVYQVKVVMGATNEEMLLKTIPWGVLTLSLFLTLFYSFIKYIILKRASEMRALNEGLARKNIELKGEIKKREAINFAVRQSEQENKAIINSINEVIFELNTDEEIMFVNDTWERMTGYNPAETINQRLFSYLEGEEGVQESEKLQNLLSGKSTTYSSLFRVRSKDGEMKPVKMAISMLRQDQKKNLRVVGTLTDLAEKEKAEQAIASAEENYKRIWKNAANGIYEMSLSGQLISANPAMAKILGYDDTEQLISYITNMSGMVYVNAEEKENYVRSAIEKRESEKFEIKAYRKSGEEIWLEEFIQPVTDENDKIVHIEGTIDDITERKRAANELMKAKAESDMANRAKSDFLANMSHELRTPLNSIIGFAEIIRDQVMGKIKEPAYSEYAGEIHKSGNGLLAIINQILDVSKIESGNRELNESLVKLEKASGDTVQLFSEKIKDKQITVINNINDGAKDLIAEDRSVKQMLYNVMSNAVKFTPNKGEITIDASIGDDGSMRVAISDTGEGLTPDQVERALRPFDLLDGEHSREKYGAGLGLTLVKLLMDMHGGHIDMQSEKGTGTTVSLVFPKERVRGNKKEEAVSITETSKETPVMSSGFEGADIFETGSDSIH